MLIMALIKNSGRVEMSQMSSRKEVITKTKIVMEYYTANNSAIWEGFFTVGEMVYIEI